MLGKNWAGKTKWEIRQHSSNNLAALNVYFFSFLATFGYFLCTAFERRSFNWFIGLH